MRNPEINAAFDRRSFLKGSSVTTLMMLMGGVPIRAEGDPEAKEGEEGTKYQGVVTPVNCGVIGCGAWGREVLKTLARLPAAPVVAICDTYESFLKRAGQLAPQAERCTDYRKLLERKEVQAVIIATPSHQHRGLVEAALEAGKHVYCEVPLAHTVEDARAIAKAAHDHPRLNFQAGLQGRADPQHYYLVKFVRTGAMGKTIAARSQWHKKQSWRLASMNPERERELNWRLNRVASPGLVGEIGIHQLDLANWFLMSPPAAVSGHGSTMQWNDGRDVPDTIQAEFEYPGGETFTCSCSLAYSFDAEHTLFYGTHSTIMCRDRRAWMFKEVDSPLLGWEVYARKEGFYKESGIVLDANSTKQAAHSKTPAADPLADDETPLHYALRAFVINSNNLQAGVEDYTANYDANDAQGLKQYLATLEAKRVPSAGYRDGLEATVTALKANEAILTGRRVQLQKAWFELA